MIRYLRTFRYECERLKEDLYQVSKNVEGCVKNVNDFITSQNI